MVCLPLRGGFPVYDFHFGRLVRKLQGTIDLKGIIHLQQITVESLLAMIIRVFEAIPDYTVTNSTRPL